jgi:capsular exopolysaccharide synthesis family protein
MKNLARFVWKPDSSSGDRTAPTFNSPVEGSRPAPELAQVRTVEVAIEPASRIVVHTEPRSPGADRFRFLRLHLRELCQTGKLRSLLVTSPLPGDGKSTIALNLATALAEKGRRAVLLIDADLHQRTIAQTLGLPHGPGLAECLESDLDPVRAICRILPLTCYLLDSGTPSRNPTEMLQSESFSRIIRRLSPLFDWIVIDAPPVIPLTDALLLSRQTDATLLVVRADKTPSEAVEEALSVVGQQNILALILNGAEGLNKRYSKYYEYYGKK